MATAQEPTDQRVAAPSADIQKGIRARLDEAVGIAKANNIVKKQQAVRELMTMAGDLATSSDELYVVLQSAFPLIRETEDIAALRVAVQKLTTTFQVDPITEQARQLEEFIKVFKSPSKLDPAVKDVVALAEAANRQNRFQDARRCLDSTETAVKKLNSKSPLLASLAKSRDAVLEREQAFVAQKQALKTLEASPDDPKANFLVGQWLAVFADDWDAALKRLAKGSDPKWQAAAKTELASTEELKSQLATADDWYRVTEDKAVIGAALAEAQLRAFKWYSKIEPRVTSPLDKTHVTKRLSDLAKLPHIKAAIPKPPPAAEPPVEVATAAKDENEFPIGKPIDLLEMVKLPNHVVLGTWKKLDN